VKDAALIVQAELKNNLGITVGLRVLETSQVIGDMIKGAHTAAIVVFMTPPDPILQDFYTGNIMAKVVGIGNCSGATIDKFKRFGLTPVAGTKIHAPSIKECYASFECRLADGRLIAKYGLFIWEVVKARVATSPRYPETLHYRGEGEFMVSGRTINRRKNFKPQNL